MKLVNVHLTTTLEEGERYDTLMAPAGTVASLLELQHKLGYKDSIGIDEAFPGKEKTKEFLHRTISENIRDGIAVLFTTLLYNAEPTVKLIRELRERYYNNARLRIIVGGQLVPLAKDAYRRNADIDSVCAGDAEVLLPRLLADLDASALRSRYEGWLKNANHRKVFSGMSYEGFYQVEERMQAQKDLAGFSQLLIQGPGGPGCSWAANNPTGACNFCALQNITTMNEVTLEEHFAREAYLQERHNPDRIFDVANQFFPHLHKNKVVAWLKDYIRERDKAGVTASKYCYLTVGSVDEEVAAMLKQAGIEEVYLGIDHFHEIALKEENKSYRSRHTLTRCLDALKKHGIRFRTGVVMGAARETPETLRSIEEGIEWLQAEYGKIMSPIGIFPVEIIPGSDVFEQTRNMGLCPDIFESFYDKGYLTREEQKRLTEAYIDRHSEVDAKEVFAAAELLQKRSGTYTVDHSLSPKVLKQTNIHRTS